jgi:hypothetical protein
MTSWAVVGHQVTVPFAEDSVRQPLVGRIFTLPAASASVPAVLRGNGIKMDGIDAEQDRGRVPTQLIRSPPAS